MAGSFWLRVPFEVLVAPFALVLRGAEAEAEAEAAVVAVAVVMVVVDMLVTKNEERREQREVSAQAEFAASLFTLTLPQFIPSQLIPLSMPFFPSVCILGLGRGHPTKRERE